MCWARAVKAHRHYVCFVRQRQTWNSHNVMMIMIYGKSFVTNSFAALECEISRKRVSPRLWPWIAKRQAHAHKLSASIYARNNILAHSITLKLIMTPPVVIKNINICRKWKMDFHSDPSLIPHDSRTRYSADGDYPTLTERQDSLTYNKRVFCTFQQQRKGFH